MTARTRLVLASALYLKAAWAAPFPAAATEDAPFHPAPRTELLVPTMRLRARLRYLRGDGYQAVELPYVGQRLGMAVVLPDGPLPPVEGRLAASGLGGLLAGLAPRQVSLALPRFRVTGEFSLRPVLDRAGHAAGVRPPGRLHRYHRRLSRCASTTCCTRLISTWTSRAPRRPRPRP